MKLTLENDLKNQLAKNKDYQKDVAKDIFDKNPNKYMQDFLPKQDGRRLAAESKLDNMSAGERRSVIDANHRPSFQNRRIRDRAIAAAGGEEAYRNMLGRS